MADPSFDPNPDYPTHLYTNPADYFRGGSIENAFFKPAYYGGLTALGFGFGLFLNYGTKRPLLSGIQKHFILAGFGLFMADYTYKWRAVKAAERDAIYCHYIETHPDDFPPIQRQKYKDIFKPWIPIR